MKTVRLLIKGKVQGVFYRASAKKIATQLLLNGWIRNTDSGEVESLVSGETAAVDDFIKWCERGPELALVTEVIVTPSEDEVFEKFRIVSI